MSANTTRNNAKSSVQEKEEELLRNATTAATTTIEQQPLNKFSLNTKKVSGRPQPVVKTQIAKISYGKSDVNKQNNIKYLKPNSNAIHSSQPKRQTENLEQNKMESSRSSQLLEEFAQKKQEREQEIMEIQDMLNQIKSPQKTNAQSSPESAREGGLIITNSNNTEENEASKRQEIKLSPLSRSKTELELNTKPLDSFSNRLARRDTTRSCSVNAIANKARSKSLQLPMSAKESQTNKKIGYNPEEARRYMEMQKKQRRGNLLKDPAIKIKIEKEEIKKRLEELKKNTRKLVSKNIQKKEKCTTNNLCNKDPELKILSHPRSLEQKEFKETAVEVHEEGTSRILSKNSNSDRPSKKTKAQETSHRSSQSLGNILKPAAFPLLENHKRIGLLRKQESDKDFSFNAHKHFNSDKENQNLVMLTRQLSKPQENKVSKDKTPTTSKELQEQKLGKTKEEMESTVYPKNVDKDEEISDLEVPKNKLKSNENKETSISQNVTQKETPKTHELPYWLRPSAAQVYPYNFIMAVRRKLEAIAEPIATKRTEGIHKKNQETSTTGLNSKIRQKKRKSLEMFEEKQSKKVKRKPDKHENRYENVVEKSLQELQVIQENTLKQLKPLSQTLQINEEDNEEKSIGKQGNTQDPQDNKENPKVSTEDEVKSLSQFKYLQKTIQSGNLKHNNEVNSFGQNSEITPFNKLHKSLQSLNSNQGDFKQNLSKLKPATSNKSLESLNSEINSNLSSISLQLPISNTLTEVSSLRTESGITFTHSNKHEQSKSENELTSLSSQIFSSPEKRSVPIEKDFEFVKPRPVSPLSLEKIHKLKIKSNKTELETEQNTKEMDFNQLLEDFNRSLSQVIQVNEQLKCTLDKSHKILSPHSSKKSTETDRHYSSDFEKSTTKILSSLESDRLKKSLHKSNENLKQKKRQLFEVAKTVTPLSIPQKLAKEKKVQLDETEKDKQYLPELNLDFNLKLNTNSTETTEEEEDKSPPPEIEDEGHSTSSAAAQSHEERLYEIEKLKETLKQTILESKEKRKEKQHQQELSKERQQQIEKRTESEKHYQNLAQETLANKNNINTNIRNSYDSSEMRSEIETRSEANISEKHSPTISKQHYNKYNSLEQYQKQQNIFLKGNQENEKPSDAESYSLSHSKRTNRAPEIPVKNMNVYYDKHSHKNKAKATQYPSKYLELNRKKALEENPQEITDYTSFHSNTNSNNASSNRKEKLDSDNQQHTRLTSPRHKKQKGDSEPQSYNETQSEVESSARTSSKFLFKRNKPEADISSSIAEELQNTYENATHDNENIPLNSKPKTDNIYTHNDSTQFIKSHINRSRGDFQENNSNKDQLNESQFQLAIEAASQISSTEFAQSADDEITSSVASRTHHKTASNPPSYNAGALGNLTTSRLPLSSSSPSKTNRRISIGSEIVRFFTQYGCERAERHSVVNDSLSESSLSYSNVGLYDKLIQNETNKSQHLTGLLKMREKALLDRTKGQIAWLEVQKARYKAKGLINHIVAIKKKQRGIILKMEKEREEIKRLLYTSTSNSQAAAATTIKTGVHKPNGQHNSPLKHKKERSLSTAPPLTKPKALGQQQTIKIENALSAPPILKATYELESSQALEELLKKREEDLRKRREHVERLIKWHQRLDEEEAEVLNLERQLLSYNNVPHMVEQQQSKLPTITAPPTTEKLTSAKSTYTSQKQLEQAPVSTIKTPEKIRASRARKMEKRLKEIDRSLKELSHISASSTTSGVMGQNNNENEDTVSSVVTQEVDFVRTTGMKLNKLWKRLTSQQLEKFEPSRRYKLCKSDLERLYEEAKMAVLRDFAEDEERIAQELLEKSASNLSSSASPTVQVDVASKTVTGESKGIEVPVLNLNFSSGHSEAEEESANNSQANAIQQGNYSPSVAEENFKAQVLLNSSASSETISEQQTPVDEKQTTRLESNVQMFLALSQRIQASGRRQNLSGEIHVGGSRAGGGRLQRSLSDTEISDVPKLRTGKIETSQKNIATVASQSNSSITTNSSARSFHASEQHQRSKSSIVELTYIPSFQTETQTNNTDLSQTPNPNIDNRDESKHIVTPPKDLENITELFNHHPTSRSSVICSVGIVTPTKSSQPTSSDIATITEDSKSSAAIKTKSVTKDISLSQSSKQKSTYSGQVGTDSQTKAKEISSKLEEISAAVTQLSQMNALPSYESVTHLHSRNKSIDAPIVTTNDESNLSTDDSSYSFNFENITTDKHSSPGTSSFHPNSLLNKTLSSNTYTKEDSKNQNDTKEESTSTPPLHTDSGASTSLNSTKSKTFVKDDAITTQSQTLTQSLLESRILETYEADFESDLSNATHIEDITIPTFETTAETIPDEDNVNLPSQSTSKEDDKGMNQEENVSTEISDKTYNFEELKNSSSSNNENSSTTTSLKAHKPSPDREILRPPPPLPPPPPPPTSAVAANLLNTSTAITSTQNGNLMPDIINELEFRRHQLILNNEHLKQYEHVTAVPYMYVREIPNKPPPPYVPPAHGSPMTTIFPSEDRIKDITFRRTHELYCELLQTEYCNENGEKLPSVIEEQITNIYERIILDICREYLEEHGEILRDGDPGNFHSQLAFFNPPNRLRCIQDAIYKEVRSCLAMDKTQPKRTQIYSVYGQRAKQDHIGKIIIQEMYDEDDRWCNFHREESEVLHLMVEEMINKNIAEISKEVLLEEGGTIEEIEDLMITEEETIAEENEANHQVEDATHHEERLDEENRGTTSSILVETLNEDNHTYCVNESKEEYTVLNQTTKIKHDNQESVNVNNTSTTITTNANAVQTCT